MASIYTCNECGMNLNLHTTHLFPSDFYFEAGNKGTISFAIIDQTKYRFVNEDRIKPFFETLDYWGIQRKRTKMTCSICSKLVGYVYDDGPFMMQGTGQFGMRPSQPIPRAPRYRFKIKALRINTEIWKI
ncbi:Mss4-like protein [Tanacetum coccineum]